MHLIDGWETSGILLTTTSQLNVGDTLREQSQPVKSCQI